MTGHDQGEMVMFSSAGRVLFFMGVDSTLLHNLAAFQVSVICLRSTTHQGEQSHGLIPRSAPLPRMSIIF